VSKRQGTGKFGRTPGLRVTRYYVSQKALKHGCTTCPVKRVNARFIDDLVRGLVLDQLRAAHGAGLDRLEPGVRDRLVRQVIAVVELGLDRLVVDLNPEALDRCGQEVMQLVGAAPGPRPSTELVPTCALKPEVQRLDGVTRLVLAIQFKRHDGGRLILSPEGKDLFVMVNPTGEPVAKDQLVQAVGLAFAWHRELLASGATIESLAKSYGVTEGWVRALLPLTQLSPAILKATLTGKLPARVTLTDLSGAAERLGWEGQGERVGG
jgi:hypothetical protein